MKHISIATAAAVVGTSLLFAGGASGQGGTDCSDNRDYCETQTAPSLTVRGSQGGRLKVPMAARGFGENGKRLSCAVRNFKFRATIRTEDDIRRARVFVDSRLIKTTRSKRVVATVPVRRLKRGRHVLRLSVTDEAGRSASSRVRFRVCAKAAGLPTRRPGFTG